MLLIAEESLRVQGAVGTLHSSCNEHATASLLSGWLERARSSCSASLRTSNHLHGVTET